jgi:sirohydrochlorin ferrochelatase
MKSLILVAHGSRRGASNDEVRLLTRGLAEKAGDSFDQVSCAFLELAEPSIPDGIEQAVQAGADEVVVLPYFLSAGRHVAEDIPALVGGKQREHPRVRIRIAEYLGSEPAVTDVLLDIARSTTA